MFELILISRKAFLKSLRRAEKVKILVAVLALVLLFSPACAQNMGGKGGKGRNAPQNSEQQKADQQKKKAADDAYKAGLKTIPDAKEKFDPWKSAR